MNKAELDAIEARAQAATPGPWEDCPQLVGVYGNKIDGFQHLRIANCHIPLNGIEYVDLPSARANAAFIAAARQDVPALLAEVRRLQAERDIRAARKAILDRLEFMRKDHLQNEHKLIQELIKLRAKCDHENERYECVDNYNSIMLRCVDCGNERSGACGP